VTNPRKTPLLIIDIALPRDFDPHIGTLPSVMLKNLYDLKEVVDRNLQKREREIPKVKQIIAEEVQKFLSWKASLQITPIIQTLTEHFETIRRAEVDKQRKHVPDEIFSQVDRVTHSLTKKYVHVLISRLKEIHDVCSLDAHQLHIIQQLFESHEIFDQHSRGGVKRKPPGLDTDPHADRPS
jgi:glutamyl-tRNA reductase